MEQRHVVPKAYCAALAAAPCTSQHRFLSLRLMLFLLLTFVATAGSAQMYVYVDNDGNAIRYNIGSGDTRYNCIRVSLDNGPWHGGFCSGSGAGYVSSAFYCNWVGTHTVKAEAYNTTNRIDLGSETVTVYAPPPASCNMALNEIRFDITSTTPANDRRVLLSNTHVTPGTTTPVYPYPQYQALLAKDRAIPMNLRIFYNAAPTAGVPVTLKIIDPPDPSAYVIGPANWPGQPLPGAALSHTDDNVGGKATFLGNCVPCATYSVTSGANGYIETELDFPADARAGDNYQIEATATFPDGTTKTARSGIVTGWKRMFVEEKLMFRRGAPLATDAPAGIDRIIVRDLPISSTGERFARNDQVMLLHAPAYGQPKGPGTYYSGLYQIVRRPTGFTAAAPVAGPGTVTTNGTTLIVGVDGAAGRDRVRFDRLDPGDVINLYSGGVRESRVVITVTDRRHLNVDKPTTSAAANLNYELGDHNLIVGAAYQSLRLDRVLGESYQREPLVDPLVAPDVLELNDAVVRLAGGGVTSADYFDSSDNRVVGSAGGQWSNIFPSAYTEYIVLPSTGPVMPLPRATFRDGDPLAQWFVNKWFRWPAVAAVPPIQPPQYCGIAGCGFVTFFYSIPDNHQLLLVGDSPPVRSNVGQTFSTGLVGWPGRQRCSVLNRGAVEYEVSTNTQQNPSLYGLNADTILEEVEVHELAHQWDVNGTTPGHCQRVGYDSTTPYPPQQTPPAPTPPGTLFCTMAFDTGLTMPAPWNGSILILPTVRQYGDGHTSFHMTQAGSTWDSEYLTIRRAADPWRP